MKSKEKDNGLNFICIPSAMGPLIIPYKLERSRRVKRMHLQINCPQFVVLKMPMRVSAAHGTSFLKEHGEWIRQTLAKQPRVPKIRDYLMRDPRVSLSGRWYRLNMRFVPGTCSSLVDDSRRRVDISMNPRMPTEAQLISIMRGIAKDYLPPRLAYWANRIGVKTHGVTVRDQKGRWGSCSETGGISLNWRLILIAPKLQDHVLLHELAHLQHFDHSRAFHQFLNALDPHSEKHARMLDDEASRVIYLGRTES